MTSAFFMRRLALLATLASSVWLIGCNGGGGSGGGTSTVRAINLTTDLTSLDVYIGGTKQFSTVPINSISSYVGFDANSYAVNINSAGNSTALFTNTYTFSKDGHYTTVVWGSQSSLRVSALPEDEDASGIASGNTRVRMFNATTESGSMDVYFTATDADLASTTATQASLTPGTLAGFREIPAGTYRLRITDLGKPDVIRLDIPSVTLVAGTFSTLVITAGPGGMLVNSTLIQQQSTATGLLNTKARVRAVASVDAGGVVSANVSGTLISSNITSPAIDTYKLVDAGNVNATVRVNNNTVLSGNMSFTAGADYTLLVYGPAATATVVPITDDNRIPLTTSRTKIRLVNGVNGLGALTLLVDLGPVGSSSNVTPGVAAPFAQISSNSASQIEVDSTLLNAPVYLTTRTAGDNLASQGVYSVFVLAGKTSTAAGATTLPNGTVPTATLRNERP